MKLRTRISSSTTVTALAAVGVLLLGACSSPASGSWSNNAPGQTLPGGSGPSSAAGNVTLVPAANAKDVSPGDPVTVNTTGDVTVTSVTLTAGSATVAGDIATDGHSWTSTGALKYDTKYTLTVQTNGLSNNTTTSTFTTLKPTRTIRATFAANPFMILKDGGTYGVGEPIIINFSRSIPTSAREAVEKALTVDATPAVEGRWHWMSNSSVHYRGENYWAAGSTITVHADLLGVKMGSGSYGASNQDITIHIGDSHVLIADNKTHYMKVYVNGKMVRNIPVSMGMGGHTKADDGHTVTYWTHNGPHVVMIKTPTHVMSSASYGITDPKSPFFYPPETIKDTVRISNSGEFVHMADWNIPAQGHSNTSHGCINVGPANALWVYNLLTTGDVVDVVNSPEPLQVWDGVGDWTIPWSKW
ncbi:MAG TPA: Ig-like domain-containing protein [Micromonosporaceae bacterium]|nr:Ig-like domain-containing protein [Micromonosporaceae bacterium]